MPKIKVLIKGLNKALEFPSGTSMPDIEKAIKGNWGQVEEGKRGFKATTGDKSIDSNIKEIVSMTPDEYLAEAFNVTDGSLGGNFNSWMGSNARGAETRSKYASDMLRGDEFPLPYIDYAAGSQDGRNRAMAAKIAGIDRIPVGIIPDKSVADKIAGIKSELLTAKGLKEYRLKNELERLLAASPKLAVAATAGAAALTPEEAEASFLGQGAKKAALDMLGMANKMENAGIGPDEIWNKTGWGKGADNKWRFEVSDDMSRLNMPTQASGRQLQDANDIRNHIEDAGVEELGFEMELMDFKGTPEEYRALELKRADAMISDTTKSDYPLETVLDHPELLGADPSLKGINTQFRNSWQSNRGAAYTPSEDSIRIGRDEYDKGSSMLHEVQHAIQQREGFAKGGSPDTASRAAREHFDREKMPIYKGYNQAKDALWYMGRYGKADYIARLDQLSRAENIRPSSITGLSDFYGYSDEIRSKFGAMPKTKAKGQNGWLQSAAAYIKNKNLEGVPHHEMDAINAAILDPKKNKSLYNKAKRSLDKSSEELRAFRGIEQKQKEFDKLTPLDQYKALAGEVEARNVQARLGMTPAERRGTPPWKTEDVPRSEQIIKYGGAGGAVGLAALSPEEAQAQRMIANNILLDDSLRSLPSFTVATAPMIDQQKLPSHLRASVGGIEAPSQLVPNIVHDFGQALHNLEFPLVGKPLEGVADYLMNFGYDDSRQERFKRAALAGLDII